MNGGAKSGTWIGGAAFVSVIIVIMGWFLVISPQRDRLSDANSQKSSVETQNATLTAEISALKKQFAKIDEYTASIGQLSARIPGVRGMSAFNKEIADLSTATGVTLSALSISPSIAVVPAVSTVPAPAASASASPSASAPPSPSPSASSTDTAAQPTVTPGISGFASTAVEITITAPYAQSEAFLAALQSTVQRYYLVTGVSMTSLQASAGGNGTPPTKRGDVQTVISGIAFTLPLASTTPTPAPSPTAPPVLPRTDRDPIPPVVGN